MPKWYEWVPQTVGTAIGSAIGGPTGGAVGNQVGNLAGSLLGGKKKGKQETTSYQNIPPEFLQAWTGSYLPGVMNLYNSGPNEYQKKAIASYGGGIEGLEQELPRYQKFYEDNLSKKYLRELEDESNAAREAILDRYAGRGGMNNTYVAQELALLEKNKQNRIADYKHDLAVENFDKATNLRRQTLADLMTAGDQPRQRVDQLGALLGRFPIGAVGTQYQMPQPPNYGDMGAGVVKSLGHLFDNYQGNKASYVPAYDVTGWQDIGDQRPWLAPNFGYPGQPGQPGIY